jgi:hypothetical protein
MVAALTRILLVSLVIVPVRAELQLTPSVSEYELDGVKFKQLAFANGDKKATYQPPAGWSWGGGANQLTLRPAGKSQAEAVISKSQLAGPAAFDDETIKKLVVEAIASVPKDGSAVKVISQEKNPLVINRKETFQVIVSYNLFGQSFDRSILFLNNEREQLRFELVARASDFKELQRAFQSSLYTWQNI